MKNRVKNIFLDIVQIDSPSGHEHNMASYLKSWLKENGFRFKEDSLGNIFAHNNQKGEPILLCAHMDTVEPGKNIKPAIKNGFIYSDGSTILGADNKASIAAILASIEEYKEKKEQLPPVELLFSVKEEIGGGIEYFPFNWIKSKEGFVFDSAKPLGGIVLSSPSITNFTVTFIGKPAHSSQPEKGNNAIIPMSLFLSKIQQGKLDRGNTFINVGQISAGTGVNTIPAKASLFGEIRSFNEKDFKKHTKKIKSLAQHYAKQTKTKLKFTTDGYYGGYKHKKTDLLIKKTSSILKELNLNVQYHHVGGISDANPLIEAGIQTINLTDGVENPHTTKERISIKNLQKLQSIIELILQKFV